MKFLVPSNRKLRVTDSIYEAKTTCLYPNTRLVSDKPEELLGTLPPITLNCIRQNCTVLTKMTSTVVRVP